MMIGRIVAPIVTCTVTQSACVIPSLSNMFA